MYAKLVDFGPTIRLVPNSGIQFVEYGFNIDQVVRFSRRFIEREVGHSDGESTYELITAWDEANPSRAYDGPELPADHTYTIDERKALEVFSEKWVPVPMLRIKSRAGGVEALDHGPTNWARVRVVEAPERGSGSAISHRVIFAFDTELMERRQNRPYTAPSREDASNDHEFRFAYSFADIAWFLGAPIPGDEGKLLAGFQDWVPAWLSEMFREFKQALNPDRPLRASDFPHALEDCARYLAFLELLSITVKPRIIRLVDTVSANPIIKPVSVDLILDVGNSRTCGILIESHPNDDSVDLNNSLVLGLRDLSEPERTYTEPFESHIEFSEARFGRQHLSVRSARARAFFWPSPVRVGPEAARFRQGAQGNEASTGLSSPKRYLCDVKAVNQEWRFPERDYAADGTSPLIDRALRQFVNLKGDVIEQLEIDRKRYGFPVSADDRLGATRLSFSRSSLFTFMVAEILCHALSMINNPAVREQRKTKDSPRKLRRIIMTLPPAISVQEQRLMRSRAEGAVKLIWKLMGWWDDPPPGLVLPEVHVSWDEASCVQFVYLYGEITGKLGGSTEALMRLMGKKRPFSEPEQQPAPAAVPEPSVRIASIDVGGGTSDLMITTYYLEGRAIKPTQNFREGFRTAGDDILKGVVERLVLPAIQTRLAETGHPDPRGFLLERFGGDRANMAEQEKHLRRQFVLRVLEPIALKILSEAEQRGAATDVPPGPRPLTDFFAGASNKTARLALPPRRITDFIDVPAREQGAADFAVADCLFQHDDAIIAQVVHSVLDHVVNNMCEAINELDCDVLLLSGRPSRLPAVVDLIVNKLAIRPERVIPLHLYKTGGWFPFRSSDNRRIGDPKTTTAVGGMLCALAESQITNFTIFTARLGLRSTAKYIGEMERDGRLLNSKLYFRDIDLDQRRGSAGQRATFAYYAPMWLGYRQLPLERWIASPLYRLRMRPGLDVARVSRPIEIVLERNGDDQRDAEIPDAVLRAESMKEEFRIESAFDAKGVDVRAKMELVLNTLNSDQGYWLDTGILSVG